MSFKFNSASPSKADAQVLPREFYDTFLSDFAKSCTPSPVWDLFPLELRPGMLSMLVGKPNPVTFPFTSLSVGVRDADTSNTKEITLTNEELTAGLQYSFTRGMPVLLEWITNLMKQVHGGKDNEGWRVSLGPGSQDLLSKTLVALINLGDSVLVEAPSYPGALPIFLSLKCHVVDVISDSEGIDASSLEMLLENWPRDKPKPKLLYTIPYGSNPTGLTTSQERRIEVLQLARKHNFIIVEDDPYFYLYFGSKPRPISYFNLERAIGVEIGRVVRLDSMSKVLAAGFRFGWVTGPGVLLNAIDLHSTTSSVQASSIVQILIYKLLSTWGMSGFFTHCERVSEFYRVRRDSFEDCLRRHMTGLAEWTTPEAGMFYWVKLLLPPSGNVDIKAVEGDNEKYGRDATAFIRNKALEKNVLALPGSYAFIDNRRTAYVRMSFSLMSEAEMDEALKRLATVLCEEWDVVTKASPKSE
ncbi:hypothetical protein AX17_005256 [Amanita inopinata Kibby_2008]|nr:hypothetical protein AX17_005256 [Amanita inopinata Kibby_2008]